MFDQISFSCNQNYLPTSLFSSTGTGTLDLEPDLDLQVSPNLTNLTDRKYIHGDNLYVLKKSDSERRGDSNLWTALHPTNEDLDNWSPATTITMPTIITTTTTTMMTTTETTNDMFYGSRLGQLESNNYKELSKSRVEVIQGPRGLRTTLL